MLINNLATKNKILIAISVGWGLLVGLRSMYPVLIPYFTITYKLNFTTAGLLITILWLGSGLGQLPGGILADLFGGKKIMITSLFVVSLSMLGIIFAPDQFIFLILTGLLGIGISLYPIARITVISRLFPERVGSYLGIVMAFGDIGQTIIPALGGIIAITVGWQFSLGYAIPFFIITGIFILKSIPNDSFDDTQFENSLRNRLNMLLNSLKEYEMIMISFVLSLYFVVWMSFTAFFPTYLTEIKELSLANATIIYALFFAFGVIFKPLAGFAYDSVGIRQSLVVIHLTPALGLIILAYTSNIFIIILTTIIISSVLGSGAITQSYLSSAFTSEIEGTGIGIVRTVTLILGSSGPVIFGMLIDNGFFSQIYLILAMLLIISVMVILISQ